MLSSIHRVIHNIHNSRNLQNVPRYSSFSLGASLKNFVLVSRQPVLNNYAFRINKHSSARFPTICQTRKVLLKEMRPRPLYPARYSHGRPYSDSCTVHMFRSSNSLVWVSTALVTISVPVLYLTGQSPFSECIGTANA